jgi:hypothetical protein
MIGMLVVMFMIMDRAKDPSTWQWLTNEFDSDSANTKPRADGDDEDDDARPVGTAGSGGPETRINGAPAGDDVARVTDLDAEEADAAREEFQAISDRKPLLAEEMPSYWRLLNWVRNQPGDSLQRRSRKAVVFTDFVEEPDKNRGKLVHLRLHVMRSLTYETQDSPTGIKRLYEAWGWTDEGYPWLYAVVFPECPPGMPIGSNARAEVSFDGYFLKLMSYEAHQSPGKPLFAPLLIGRIVWHPVEMPNGSDGTWFWVTAGAGGLIILMGILRWVIVSRATQLTEQAHPAQSSTEEIESWLEQAEANVAVEDSADGSESLDCGDSPPR